MAPKVFEIELFTQLTMHKVELAKGILGDWFSLYKWLPPQWHTSEEKWTAAIAPTRRVRGKQVQSRVTS